MAANNEEHDDQQDPDLDRERQEAERRQQQDRERRDKERKDRERQEAEDRDRDKSAEELRAEADRLRKALSESNRKAAADRKRLEDLDRERQEREDAKLSEADRARKEAADAKQREREKDDRLVKLEAENLQLRIDREVERQAGPLFEEPSLAPKLVDRARIEVDEESGKIAGVKDALERVLKDHPSLARTGSKRGGSPAAMTTKRAAADRGGRQSARLPGEPEGDRDLTIREAMALQVGIDPM